MIYQGHEFCPDPDPPYRDLNKVDVTVNVVNTTNNPYFTANFSVKETLAGYSWRFKIGFEKEGKVIIENDFKGLSCNIFLPKLIYRISSINYNHNTCDIFKGNYTLHKLEISTLDRAVNYLPTRRLGIYAYYLSYYKPKGTCFCIQSRLLFTKA
ncbi:hypothetical protein B5X24_HaOG210517 [Helicoverpa armigera]|uniref:Uncharacterized protein n=1 Tax=Helicoverpa armigera TaxID=29058 RepID=A0A2W1BC56_HELAM|nr:hypothetical protein B5X24_HaOG210517 [Helicoverpa armigera]